MNQLRTFRRCFAILCILTVTLMLAGCTFLRKAEETLDKANAVYGQVKEEIAKADTNKDGSLSTAEIMAYILGLLGLGGAAKGALLSKDRKVHKETTADHEERLAAIEEKVKP